MVPGVHFWDLCVAQAKRRVMDKLGALSISVFIVVSQILTFARFLWVCFGI